ncbi:MAG: hypothetical protein ACI9QD_000829 [Thermoproteota archaeon]|jgi:hypothetical protein
MMKTPVIDPKNLGIGRLIFLAVVSVFLSASLLMTVFAPIPLSLGVILYGRQKGYAVGVLSLVLAFALDPTVGSLYFFCFLFAILVSEITLRDISPLKGLMKAGGAIVLIGGLIAGSVISSFDKPLKELIVTELKSKTKELEQMKLNYSFDPQQETLLDQPEKFAEFMIQAIPVNLFVGTFIILWVNLFIVLKGRRVLLGDTYKYNEKEILKFKVPEQVVWIVIPLLALAVFGDDVVSPGVGVYAMMLTSCIGVFYFFHGFGVYNQFLDSFKVFGMLRSFLVILTVLSMNKILALVGLFDLWVNFSRFFRKEEQNS